MQVASPWLPAPTQARGPVTPPAPVRAACPDPIHGSLGSHLLAGALLGLAAVGIAGAGAPMPSVDSISTVYQDPAGDRVATAVGPHGSITKTYVNVDGDVFVRRGDPNAIGRIADQCRRDAAAGRPAACASINLSRGYVVLKSRDFPHEFLTLPTKPVTGVEDPQLVAPGAENYFADAWRDARAQGTPRDAVGLAVNSMDWRSQDRLHIHSDAMDPQLGGELKAALESGKIVAGRWTPLDFLAHGHHYQATWVDGKSLTQNPFQLVHDRLARAGGEEFARTHMGEESIAVVGETDAAGRAGFVILNGHVNQDPAHYDGGFAEEWLKGHAMAAL